uniref:Uncharacterized protein n=1 Tax=Anguilla anguilla TaxID=7936 RepID=A0A0E9PJJ4_ANGAN
MGLSDPWTPLHTVVNKNKNFDGTLFCLNAAACATVVMCKMVLQ